MAKGDKKEGGKKAAKADSEPEEPTLQGPTERDILEATLERLKSVLKSTTEEHQASRERVLQLQALVEEVEESEEACVRHLLRQMSLQEEESREATSQWQAEKEAAELEARRGEALLQAVRRNAETESCLFQQEMEQLEDKVDRLKDKRLERQNQEPRLQELTESLQQREAEERLRQREADAAEVGRLLQRRSAFGALVGGLTAEGADVFKLSLPCEWRRRLAEDMRLRAGVASTAEDVLRLQERLRWLKRDGLAVEAEEETHASAGVDIEEACREQGEWLRRLEEKNVVLEKNKGITIPQSDLASLRENLRRTVSELSRVRDEIADVGRIRADQSRCEEALRAAIEAQRNRNGLVASELLRAAQLGRARLEEEELVTSGCDVDLLRQMALLLKEAEG